LQAGQHESFELQERLLEEHRVIEIAALDPAGVQAEVDGALGK
jgi:hypothetical protein